MWSSVRSASLPAAVAVLFLVGCFRDESVGRYSGEFHVENHSKLKIAVGAADGFGAASPVCGTLPQGGKKGLSFGWLDSFPDKCVLHWAVIEPREEFSQEIDLVGVVPTGKKGVVVFTFGEDQVWSVQFEPEK